ncbi:MAG: nucleoside deaminase [Parcubacteria group bacterium]
MIHPNKEIMGKAIEEAKVSSSLGQYALGAVIVDANGEVIATEHTTTHATNDATAHAEVNVIRSACKKLDSRYLPGCWLYTTLEPCPMCAAAAIWAKMEGVVFGATKNDAVEFSKKLGKEKFTWRQIDMSASEIVVKGDPKIKLVEKFMREECLKLFEFANKE